MKKILNTPERVVQEMCFGMTLACPQLAFDPKYKIVRKKVLNPGKVSLISGGGSGHEPAHAGFVGTGMLDAAVCGDIFASPSQIQVYRALKMVTGEKGTLMIIKNYSGDIMNFQNAAHMATEDGLTVDYVKVEDDVAVQDSLYTVGRRGVAGTVLVHKIAGAAAERGWPLSEVKRVAQKAADNVRSIGVALTSCTVPAKGSPTFELAEDEMEYGVGIHGEPGICREKLCSAQQLANRMVRALAEDLAMAAQRHENIVLLVNGFGATPLQEQYILNYWAFQKLAEYDVTVTRNLVGNYMTSIDMAGVSLSIMRMDDELQSLMDDCVNAPALAWHSPSEPLRCTTFGAEQDAACPVSFSTGAPQARRVTGNVLSKENIIYLVDKMSEIIIREETAFCELDSHAGDGDFGMSVAKGFRQLKREWPEMLAAAKTDIGAFLEACSIVIMAHCGGASGPIWGSAFRAAGKATAGKMFLSVSDMAAMLQAAVDGIQTTGARSFGRGAVVGDKTLIDALAPCAGFWAAAANTQKIVDVFRGAAAAAVEGAEQTKAFAAHMGRAGTVGHRSIGYPDAGAYALGYIFTELGESLCD